MALLISRQSISQKRADTVVVKETHELTKVKGVEPVTSSHCAFEGPPDRTKGNKEMSTLKVYHKKGRTCNAAE